MKSGGLVRNLDELGRIVIPKEIRKQLEINQKDPLNISVSGKNIVLSKLETGCVFCNNTSKLTMYKDKLICKNCLKQLINLDFENEK